MLNLIARNGTEWTIINEISSRLPRIIDTLIKWSTEWHNLHGSSEHNELPEDEKLKRIYYQAFCVMQFHVKFSFNKHNFFVLLNRTQGVISADYTCPFFTRNSYGPEALGKCLVKVSFNLLNETI